MFETKNMQTIFEVLDPDLGCLVLEPFSENMFQTHLFCHALGGRSQADQAEMVHGPQLGP